MPSLKETKRRLASVENTQKITRAMKLVSAAKYSRALQKKEQNARYKSELMALVQLSLAHASARVTQKYCEAGWALRQEGGTQPSEVPRKELVVVMAADRGLCGPLNAQVLKKATETIAGFGSDPVVEMMLWGKKAWPLARSFPARDVVAQKEQVFAAHDYAWIREQAMQLFTGFVSGRWQTIHLIYPGFVNVLTQQPRLETFLPLEFSETAEQSRSKILFEPEADRLFGELATKALVTRLFHVVLEGAVSEQAARMTAMDNATQNASDVIHRLTLEYYRVRQAAITTELVEITGGAEAL